MHLRSVELNVTNRAAAAEFLQGPWGLADAGARKGTSFLRGSAARSYVMAVTEASANGVASVTFAGDRAEIEAVRERVSRAGLRHGPWVEAFDEPGSGAGFCVSGAEGEPFRFVVEQDTASELSATAECPLMLSHVVFNTRDREAASRVLTDVFGFKLSDRTRIMNFLRSDNTHHAIAYADAKNTSLNHIAFEMKDTDAVMRGMGRLKDVGCPTVWGPGRHGPGNNVFSYFVAPFGACLEYTAEVQRVDDTYPTGTPESWRWPPGRNDHWGIASRDDAKLAESGNAFPYASLVA